MKCAMCDGTAERVEWCWYERSGVWTALCNEHYEELNKKWKEQDKKDREEEKKNPKRTVYY